MKKEPKIVRSPVGSHTSSNLRGHGRQFKMRRLLIIYFVLGLLNPVASFGQLNISNSVELIKMNKVKEVHIFKTNLSDTSNKKMQILRLTFTYDTIGRRISVGDFHNGKLVGTYYFYYNKNSFACLKSEYVSAIGQIYSNVASGGDIFNCQQEIYSSSSKFITSYTSSGLLSVIVDYSKVLIEKGKNGNIIDESGNLTNDYIHTINTNEPQVILRFEYTYY